MGEDEIFHVFELCAHLIYQHENTLIGFSTVFLGQESFA